MSFVFGFSFHKMCGKLSDRICKKGALPKKKGEPL